MADVATDPPLVSIALQGGGAHGAFTWGVLDRLLELMEEGHFRIAALSGTSAGAMNAGVCAAALADGPAAARAALELFWTRASFVAWQLGNPYMVLPYNAAGRKWNFDNHPLSLSLNMTQSMWSPYCRFEPWSPFSLPSLTDVVAEVIGDFDWLNAAGDGTPSLYVAATDVGSGTRRVFGPGELSADVLLASACLPNLERAVEIDGRFYWDGGYTANPALKPLIKHASDLIYVQLNPAQWKDVPPRTPACIADRLNEITCNASLVSEISGILAINKALTKVGPEALPQWKFVNLHPISDDCFMATLGLVSKFNLQMAYLQDLRKAGLEAGDRFVRTCLGRIGRGYAVNVHETTIKPFYDGCPETGAFPGEGA